MVETNVTKTIITKKLKWVMLKLSNNSNNNEKFEISVKVKRRERKNLILELSESVK
jgi:hypothetical protein